MHVSKNSATTYTFKFKIMLNPSVQNGEKKRVGCDGWVLILPTDLSTTLLNLMSFDQKKIQLRPKNAKNKS
jgi:hypothetical protein